MTCMKKLTALLVSAALALSLLAGCGGSKALSQMIADLLSGMYNNVTVEVDPDLTAALKKASAAGSTQEEVLAALVEELNLSGVRLTLRQLEEGRQGDRGVELVFQPGTDPDAAARSAVNGWASAFGALPDDGSYSARVSMIEADGGYYIAVDVEVLKAGTPDKDDPEPKPDYTTSTENGVTTYTVYTAAGLQKWAEAAKVNPSTSCTLGDNITLTGNWTPIGTDWEHAYTGTFDGQGHTIFGLDFSSSDEYAGLFGYIGEKGKVQNLPLDSPTVSSTNADGYVGAVAGCNEDGTIENCHVTGGSISGNIAGGVVGINGRDGSVIGCSSSAKVNGTGSYTSAGGVVGYNLSSTVTGCSSTGTVTGDVAGGVVGCNDTRTVTACYFTGTVNGNTTGGVVGSNTNAGEVTACYFTGTVNGNTTGGVVGVNSDPGSTVTACYATGKVESDYIAGGVVGYNYPTTITACYWSGSQTQGIGGGYQATDPEYSPSGDNGETPPTNKVPEGTTWSAATTAMNNAIAEWNQSATVKCNYSYDTSSPPKLKAGAPPSTTP